jgi:D-cysteine desulfhydrase
MISNILQILQQPTPINRLCFNSDNELYIKRDDLIDFALGGNKARKMANFLYDMMQKNYNAIITYGSVQSNHCRIISAVAARLGLKCILVLEGKKESLYWNGNNIFYYLADAEIQWTDIKNVSKTINYQQKKLQEEGYNPYFIPGGGHSYLGTRAYVDALDEIMKQGQEIKKKFDYIFLASGTGTTQTGLIIGKTLKNIDTKIIGISIARQQERGIKIIEESIEEYSNFYQEKLIASNCEILFEDQYIGEKYGNIYPEIIDIMKRVYQSDSIILDPTYTGKAFYGMTHYLESKKIRNKNILFLHTGGLPCFFGQLNNFLNQR